MRERTAARARAPRRHSGIGSSSDRDREMRGLQVSEPYAVTLLPSTGWEAAGAD